MVGDMERYGLPKPDHKLFEAHPTVSDDILSRIVHGEVTPKPNIAELTETTVRFTDGTEVEADIVVYCTGYKVTFPFFDPALIAAPDNDLPLFRRDVPPGHPERVLRRPDAAAGGDHADRRDAVGVAVRPPRRPLPPAAAGRAACRHGGGAPAMFRRYVRSKRHTMQVDFDDWMLATRKEREAGARGRARRATPAGAAAAAVPA